MKNKKIILFIFIILIIIFGIILGIKMIKKTKSGNNISSQEIVDKILNINSYIAKIKVQINSNKNKNIYILRQEYNTENGFVQEVIEPTNIAGVKIIRKDNILTIENTELDLKTIFEDYNGLENNNLDLINFINEYKENDKSFFEEKNNEIIFKTSSEKDNIYQKNKVLYIDKNNIIPTKLIVQDYNQNSTIIIEYNEIELN